MLCKSAAVLYPREGEGEGAGGERFPPLFVISVCRQNCQGMMKILVTL